MGGVLLVGVWLYLRGGGVFKMGILGLRVGVACLLHFVGNMIYCSVIQGEGGQGVCS